MGVSMSIEAVLGMSMSIEAALGMSMSIGAVLGLLYCYFYIIKHGTSLATG